MKRFHVRAHVGEGKYIGMEIFSESEDEEHLRILASQDRYSGHLVNHVEIVSVSEIEEGIVRWLPWGAV